MTPVPREYRNAKGELQWVLFFPGGGRILVPQDTYMVRKEFELWAVMNGYKYAGPKKLAPKGGT